TLFEPDPNVECSVIHTDFSNPYCPDIREALLVSAGELDVPLGAHCTYVCVDGPRFESPAEIRMFASWGGDVVGMTGLPEAVFAREAGICYAGIAIVTNYGTGLAGEPVNHEKVVEKMAESVNAVRSLIFQAMVSIP